MVRIETLGAQEARRSSISRPPSRLLVVPYLSKKNAALFQEAGLNFIDTAGNAFIDVPGCYVFISGKQRLEQAPPGSGHKVMGAASALRVFFTLLTESDMPGSPIRDIATKAGVSLGSAAKALEGLRRLGHLSPGDTKSRRLLAADTLRLEWARNYPIALRSKLNPQRYAPQNGWWWKDAKLLPGEAAWGGEVSAALKTSYLQPEQATIYCWKDRGKLLMQHRLRPDPNGTVEILDAFWTPPPSGAEPIAPLLLIYADLMTSLDGRNREVAHLLRKEIFDAETTS
ncbi:MAG: type IV toxin-antitoxin system AbiEi family antitoxin [Acidovorax sp.]